MSHRAATGGDSYTQRMRSAAVQAISSSVELRRSAERLSEELDDITPVHGIPVTGLAEEDSMVTAISDVLASAKAAAGGG